MELFKHQQEALEQTKDLNRVAYYLDMGLGKTFVGAEKMKVMNSPVNLIVCQKSKIQDWIEHFESYYSKTHVIYNLTNKGEFIDFLCKVDDRSKIGIINYELAWRRKDLLQLIDFTMMVDIVARVVGATEYALCLYRDKLPKFRNGVQVDEFGKNIRGTGHMVFNWFKWEKDSKDIPKIHPAQKPVEVLKQLIEIFTDEGDVVIDPCCGSGSTLRAAREINRSAFGFEIDRNFYTRAKNEMLSVDTSVHQLNLFS